MAFDTTTRNKLAKLVGDARKLLFAEFTGQLQEIHGIQPDGVISPLDKLVHLDDEQREVARLLRERVSHLAGGAAGDKKTVQAAIERMTRELSFTVLNRFAALRMCEERGLVQECVGGGMQSKGFKVYLQIAGTGLGDQFDRYRTFIYCLFDEIAVDLGVLFDRFSLFGLLFPREAALVGLLEIINRQELKTIWAEDETIGWIYQYFNPPEERKAMRDASQAPRNSRELAVRNQFFTPRYVVEFLTDNTLGRIWYEMCQGDTALREKCRYLVRRPNEIFLAQEEQAPDQESPAKELSQEELLKQPVYIAHRTRKDPRDLRVLDPACGSGHFLLYAFDLLLLIYEEAWNSVDIPASEATGRTLRDDFESLDKLRRHIPKLIIEHNLHGIDIDPRAVQIAGLSLWLRAQKSWKNLGIKAVDRPRITKSNIVTAEPMPGDDAMRREFTAGLSPRVLGQLLDVVFKKMELAGEAGSLLKIEEEIKDIVTEAATQWRKGPKPEQQLIPGMAAPRPKQQEFLFDVKDITDERFWEYAEDLILDALKKYAERAENGGGVRRRLFAEDAARGFAFIDLCRKRYDVVLMNPPFGLSQACLYSYLNHEYPDSFIDLLASFIVRAKTLAPFGHVGAITSRACLYTKTLLEWRRMHMSGQISVLADFGIGVLDGAMVRACAYVIPVGLPAVKGYFIDARKAEDKGAAILIGIQSATNSHPSISSVYCCDSTFFALIPQNRILYWFPHNFWQQIHSLPAIEPCAATIRAGLTTYDDIRFLRLRWEVAAAETDVGKTWVFLSKGGYFSTFYNDVHLVVLWANGGNEVGAHNRLLYNTDAQSRRGSNYYLRPTVTYSRRTDYFSSRALPSNCFFSDKGPAIIPLNDTTPAYLLGLFNSDLIRGLIHSQAQGGCFETGVLKFLPWREPDPIVREFVENEAIAAWKIKARVFNSFENDALFSKPFLITGDSFVDCHKKNTAVIRQYNSDVTSLAARLSNAVSTFFDLSSERFEDLDIFETDHEIKEAADFLQNPAALSTAIISYILGVAFGRWDIRIVLDHSLAPKLPEPFDPLPVCPPGMLTGPDGLPAEPNGIVSEAWLRKRAEGGMQYADGKWTIPEGDDPLPSAFCILPTEADYPIRITWNGIIVDDPGIDGTELHKEDIVRRVREVLDVIWKDKAHAIEQEACEILGVSSLRDYFRKPSGFFQDHLKRYSKSRRKAPIYWPLSTRSGEYTLWIYYHRLTDQTLYTCVKDYVSPKIEDLSRDIDRLQKETGDGGTAKQDLQLEKMQDFRQELNDLKDELLRVAALPYKPDLNDGVLITASPLWKLFRLTAWQKDLKECWSKLEAGDYDWAHLAYAIWPDRVKETCRTDRSIAIAHDLESLCEVEVKAPKKKKGKKKTEN